MLFPIIVFIIKEKVCNLLDQPVIKKLRASICESKTEITWLVNNLILKSSYSKSTRPTFLTCLGESYFLLEADIQLSTINVASLVQLCNMTKVLFFKEFNLGLVHFTLSLLSWNHFQWVKFVFTRWNLFLLIKTDFLLFEIGFWSFLLYFSYAY